jgi:hypothetical protein
LHDRRFRPEDAHPSSPPGWSPELDLLLLCARWPQRRAGDRGLVRQGCDAVADWQLFLHLVQHHRLVPLVFHSLQASLDTSATPEQTASLAALRDMAKVSAHQALRSLAELRRLVQGLSAENVSVRVLKGLPLAQSVFGDLSLRAPGDLDLLIEEKNLLIVDKVLRDFGYLGLFDLHRLSPKRVAFYSTHWKDLTYENPTTGQQVDLHWRCFRNRRMPGNDLCSAGETVPISFGSFTVQSPPRLETLLYLCVHGALEGWLYFKSLTDVAAEVRRMNSEQLDRLAVLADKYSVLPEVTAAVILVRRYFGLKHWSERLLPATNPTVAHILQYADRTLVDAGYLADRETVPISSTLVFELKLRQDLSYRMELLTRVLFRVRSLSVAQPCGMDTSPGAAAAAEGWSQCVGWRLSGMCL